MELTDAQLVLVLVIVPLVCCTAVVVGMLAVSDWRARRRPSTPEAAYADTGMVLRGEQLDVEALRALAAADGAAAGAVRVPGRTRPELQVEIFVQRFQIAVDSNNVMKGAPKEWTP